MKKTIITLLITILLLTACQPTPQKPVVENKNDGELEAAIMQTPAPTVEPEDTVESSEEIRITDTRTNDAGTVNVNIDAVVKLPGDENITVARVQKDIFTQQDVDAAIKALFGDNLMFYDPLVTTKADVEYNILHLQKRLTFDDDTLLKLYEDKDITDVGKIKQHINKIIKELKKEVTEVPEESPIIKELDIEKGISAKVDFGKDFMGHVSCRESYSPRPQFVCYAFGDEHESARYFKQSTSTQIDNTDSPELISAKQAAQKLVDDMGIEGVRLGDVYVSLDNACAYKENGLVSDKKFYVFCFERVVGDRTIDFTFYKGMLASDEYDKPIAYERMEVWTSGDEVVKFKWENPIKVTESINENTALQIDYEKALDIAINHIARTVIHDIKGIEFEMVMIREKDSNKYIAVPAWKIYTDVEERFSEELKSKFNIGEEFCSNYKNIFSINALDGSIIDMEKGY